MNSPDTATQQLRTDEDLAGEAASGRRSLRRVLALRDFRLLLAGTSTSLLGDQFALIATPWLALQLSDDALALGTVLALEGLRRALLMLVGGAVTDRVSSRRVMLVADILRSVLTAAMAAVVLAGAAQMWMLYAFALGFGVVAGFAVPAENSIVPTLVRRDDLQAGNAVIMGVTQFMGFAGPTLAGAVIAGFSSTTTGPGLAFAIDAVTFLVSATTFFLMRPASVVEGTDQPTGLGASIRDGVRRLWGDPAMRFVLCVLATVNLFAVGPLMVGIPLLAHDRLPSGAMAFGVLMAAFAIGNLAGYGAAGGTRLPGARTMRAIVIGVLAAYGVVIAALGTITNLALAAVLLAALGAGNGYLGITLLTWMQTRTEPSMLGRIMSLATFASLGLVSVSQAASGAISRWSLDGLFLLSGALVLATVAWAATQQGFRAFLTSITEPTHPTDKEAVA